MKDKGTSKIDSGEDGRMNLTVSYLAMAHVQLSEGGERERIQTFPLFRPSWSVQTFLVGQNPVQTKKKGQNRVLTWLGPPPVNHSVMLLCTTTVDPPSAFFT